jgi:hypothetical protein
LTGIATRRALSRKRGRDWMKKILWGTAKIARNKLSKGFKRASKRESAIRIGDSQR